MFFVCWWVDAWVGGWMHGWVGVGSWICVYVHIFMQGVEEKEKKSKEKKKESCGNIHALT